MNAGRYKLKVDEEQILFEFTSIGRKGKIKKVIQYTEYIQKGYFNLGLGDLNMVTGQIDDMVISDNGDLVKIMATVVSSLEIFFCVVSIGFCISKWKHFC